MNADRLTPLPATDPFILDVHTAAEFTSLPDPGQDALLLGPLVRRGERTIVVGDTGHGKTTLTLQMLAGILTGNNVLGYTGATSGPVLWIDLEQGQRSIKRGLRESRLHQRDDVLVITVPDGLALDSDREHEIELARVIHEHQPSAVALDPYYKAARIDANDERAVVDLMRRLDSLRAEYGFALIMPAHPRKDIAGRDGPRKLTLHDVAGSGAVTRGAEVVLGLERLSHGYARLRILKDRDGDLEVGDAWPLIFDRDHGYRLDPKEAMAQDTIENTIRTEAANGQLLTAREWGENLGIRQAKARRILEQLVEAGELGIVTGPPGRSPRARCYGTDPTLWDQSGSVGDAPGDGTTDPTDPDVSIGIRRIGISTSPTEPIPDQSEQYDSNDDLFTAAPTHHDGDDIQWR